MKVLLSILTLASLLFSVELTMKDGEIISGDLICENKGNLILRDGNQTISIFKKSIAKVDTMDVAGTRKFTLGDEYMLKEKNELIFINSSDDSLTIRLRDSETRKYFSEKSLASGDTVVVPVKDGSYYETVRYWRPNVEYYTEGTPTVIETKCDKFERIEIELRGYKGDTYPKLKGPKIAYEKE